MRSMSLLALALFCICTAARGQAPPPALRSASPAHAPSLVAKRQSGAAAVVLRPPASVIRSAGWRPGTLHHAARVVGQRLRETGITSPSVAVDEDSSTLTVAVPTGRSARDLQSLLTRTAKLEFRYVPQLDTDWRTVPEVLNGRATGFERILGPDGRPVSAAKLAAAQAGRPAFTGADLEPTCRAESVPGSPPPSIVVHFQFKPAQKARFEASTGQHIGKTLAIFIDGRLLGSARIMEAIPGAGAIMAHFTLNEARALAAQLNSGALPVPLEVAR